MFSKKNEHRHAVALSVNFLFHFWGRQIYVDKISEKLIRYQSIKYFAGDLSNNSIYYYSWSSFMMIIREIRWQREWWRRYQWYLQYFSILFRNSREISITFWWIININFNFKSMIWSICILWNRSKKKTIHSIESYLSYRVYPSIMIVEETMIRIN